MGEGESVGTDGDIDEGIGAVFFAGGLQGEACGVSREHDQRAGDCGSGWVGDGADDSTKSLLSMQWSDVEEKDDNRQREGE